MNVGIVGATGFIGSYLATKLSTSEIKPTLWQRKLHGDYLIKSNRDRFLTSHKFDLIYQAAWVNVSDINYKENVQNFPFVEASLDFARECVNLGVRIALLGSTFADDFSRSDPYSQSKRQLQAKISEMNSSLVLLIKPTYVFSLEEKRPQIFREFIDWIQNGNRIEEFPIKSNNALLDFIHVRDVVSALDEIRLHETIKGEVIVSSGILLSVKEVLTRLETRLTKSQNYFATQNSLKITNADGKTKIISCDESQAFFG